MDLRFGKPISESALSRNILSRLLAFGLVIFLPLAAHVPVRAYAETPTLSDEDVKIYKRAFKAARRLKFDRAMKIATNAENPLPAKVIRWLYLKTRNSTATFDAINAFLENNPDWPHRRRLILRAQERLPKDMEPDEVLAWFEKYPPISGVAAQRFAEALIEEGREEEGIEALRAAWVEKKFNHKQARAFRRKHRKHLTKEDHADRLDRLLWDDQTYAAKRQLLLVDKGRQRLAQARIQLIRRGPGVDYAVSKVPAELKDDPGLVYDRIRWRRRHRLTDKAFELMETAPTENLTRPDKWGLERRILARWALRRGDVSVAYRLAKNHGQTGRVERAEAEWLAGWIALRFLHEYEDAFDHFKLLFNEVRYPISRARAAYWAGRAADAAGKTEIATQWYGVAAAHNTRFYGQLAALHLSPKDRLTLPPQPTPIDAKVQEFQESELVQLLHLMAQMDQKRLVKRFLRHMIRNNKDPALWVLVGQLAKATGRGDYAIHAARYALRQGIALTETGYPNLELETDSELDASLVHGLIRQESAFHQKAVSRAGARGLMQLMPRTAHRVARKLRIRYSKARLVRDPAYNIRLGQSYLKQMLGRFDGSVILALAAYNAGPGAVERWIRAFGKPGSSILDMIDWIEQIPFTETRNYVQRVLENRTVYHSREHNLQVAIAIGEESFELARLNANGTPNTETETQTTPEDETATTPTDVPADQPTTGDEKESSSDREDTTDTASESDTTESWGESFNEDSSTETQAAPEPKPDPDSAPEAEPDVDFEESP